MDSQHDHYLRITGKVNIPTSLDDDTEYQVVGIISTFGTDSTSKQDGTFNYTHKAQFSDAVQLIKGEQVILGKKKSSWSQKWRRLIEGYGMEYDKFMAWLFTKFDELREEYEATQQTGEENHRD